MSNSKNDDFIIKFDDVEIDDMDSSIEDINDFSSSSIGDDYIFKIDDSSNKDYFIKVDDEDKSNENKQKDEFYITGNDEVEAQVDDIPDYNSPEYVDYISKLNKDSLEENSIEDTTSDESNSEKDKNKKYTKKQIQTLLFGLIGILFIASVMTFGFMIKDTNKIANTNPSESEMSELSFILNVVSTSNETSLGYYDNLREFSISSRGDLGVVNKINTLAKENLNEVYRLKDYINIDSYTGMVEQLKLRYENIIKLCNELYTTSSTNYKVVYNRYAEKEIQIIDTLNKEIMNKLDYYVIPYKVKNSSIVFEG